MSILGQTGTKACSECGERAMAERDRLEAENESLRRAAERYADVIEALDLSLEESQAENVELRELARHLRECVRHTVCAVCEYADDACDFDYDMRELGIEV